MIVKRPQALQDLAEIWGYIADDSPDRADSFADLIDSKLQTLARHPGMGRLRTELAPDLRSFPIGRYVIFYLPMTNGVEIVRVLHGSRDIETIFQESE